MIPKTKVLNETEIRVIEAVAKRVQSTRNAMYVLSEELCEREREMWEMIYGFYPELKKADNKSFCYTTYEVRYTEDSSEVSKFRKLKEEAIKNQDLENAAKYREEERKAKEKKDA